VEESTQRGRALRGETGNGRLVGGGGCGGGQRESQDQRNKKRGASHRISVETFGDEVTRSERVAKMDGGSKERRGKGEGGAGTAPQKDSRVAPAGSAAAKEGGDFMAIAADGHGAPTASMRA